MIAATDEMTRGDPVEVCRPIRGGSDWFPATIARIDADTIEVVYADFERQEFSRRQSAYVIRNCTNKASG